MKRRREMHKTGRPYIDTNIDGLTRVLLENQTPIAPERSCMDCAWAWWGCLGTSPHGLCKFPVAHIPKAFQGEVRGATFGTLINQERPFVDCPTWRARR